MSQQPPDGYVDHQGFPPGPALFRDFLEHVRDLVGTVFDRRTYEIMQDLDGDLSNLTRRNAISDMHRLSPPRRVAAPIGGPADRGVGWLLTAGY